MPHIQTDRAHTASRTGESFKSDVTNEFSYVSCLLYRGDCHVQQRHNVIIYRIAEHPSVKPKKGYQETFRKKTPGEYEENIKMPGSP